jgi:hypothetical protein
MNDVMRKLTSISRPVHTYLAMLGMFAFLLFAVSGFVLNNNEWFGIEKVRLQSVKGTLPKGLVEKADKEAIPQKLRKDFGAKGVLDSFEADENQIVVIFKEPGRRRQATIQRPGGEFEMLTEIRGEGIAAAITDMHRRDPVSPWLRFLIDLNAVLLGLATLSGFILWMSLPKRRLWGIAALLVGILTWLAAYLFLAA